VKQDQLKKKRSTALNGDQPLNFDDEDNEEDGTLSVDRPQIDPERLRRLKTLLFKVIKGNTRELKQQDYTDKLFWCLRFVM
jgi:hypothetical protein